MKRICRITDATFPQMSMRRWFGRALAAALALTVGALSCQTVEAAPVSLTTMGTPYTENFDTLSNTAGSTTNTLTTAGWSLTESGGGARDNEQYAVDTGASNTGDSYSYGATGSTDRALGGLRSGTLIALFGAAFTNNTGTTITSLDIAYTGEQWRLGTATRTDQINVEYSTNATDLATGTWTAVAALDFVTPDTATIGAKDGNGAANRTALSATISSLNIANGSTFWIRWTDTDATGADDGLAVDDFSLTPQISGGSPSLGINDVSLNEGNAGTTTFAFSVSLTAPAGPGGVTFDVATADGTATAADSDFVAQSLTGQSIPEGSTGPYSFSVTVNGDTTVEANETFFVNLTNVAGASVGDSQGQGTIGNDDVVITPIHDIQGPGASSPITGASVTIRGIVTGVRSNGFFVQEPDASVDADPATSEGILVFTSSAPPAAAAVGNEVQVQGTVAEFVPSSDPLQPPLTELTAPSVSLLSTGNPLPAAIPLTPTFPDPAGPYDQLERLEGMRVSIASLTVSGPTLGLLNEPNATATSTGVFFGVVTGVPRPQREPGIQAPDPAPSGGSIPPIPRFDSNPERIRVDSDGLVGGPLIDVGAGALVTGLVGPLDYTYRTYTLLPDPGATIGVSGGPVTTTVPAPAGLDITIATFNMLRFFDTVDDPGTNDVALTAAAFDKRLNKASLGIRNNLRMPDIVGVVEMENLTALQALAARISSDAITASQPDPQYAAYLIEGNDIGGIDVGFLVKTATVAGSTPRVEVVSVLQELAGTLFVNPDSSTELLNDRPPLLLMAMIHHANGTSFPVTVIANHLRSMSSINLETAGSNGWPTAGASARAKRQAQAEDLANLVQARQTADPTERIVLLGDFNASEFNDGLVDVMNVIAGTPPPDNQTAVPGDGIDLVNPDLANLVNTLSPGERYSFIYDGQTQSLDHILVNQAMIAATKAQRIEHSRFNADFSAITVNDATTPARLSDHDPVMAFLTLYSPPDLTLTKSDGIATVMPGNAVTYTLAYANAGETGATGVVLNETVPANSTFNAGASTAGWSCLPNNNAGSTCIFTVGTLASGASGTATFAVNLSSAAPSGVPLSNTATIADDGSNGTDPVPGNNSATDSDTITPQADVAITKIDSPDPVVAGTNLTYTLTVTNNGPSAAQTVSISDTLPAGTTFVSTMGSGWTINTPAVGAIGTVSFNKASVAAGETATLKIVVKIDLSSAHNATVSNTATMTTATADPNTANNTATATSTVHGVDVDGDEVEDALDNCPAVLNADQFDSDGDSQGNACDDDDDNDGVVDGSDAFPLDPTETTDSDGDGLGDNADPDDDGDSVLDFSDAFPLDQAESVDTDGDGIGNNADPDDDNDGVHDGDDPDPLDGEVTVLAPPVMTLATQGLDVAVSWSEVPGAAGYDFCYAPYPFLGPGSIVCADMGTATLFAEQLWEDAAYYAAIKAYDAAGHRSDYSNVDVFTQLPYPNPPVLTVGVNATTLSVSWAPVAHAQGYTLYYAPYPYAGEETIGSVEMGTATSISVPLWPGASLYLAVEAYDGSKRSGYSNVELFTIP